MNVIPTSSAQVPSHLTEEETRQLIQKNSARFNELREKVVAIKTRADGARRTIVELLDAAEQKIGTRDQAEIEMIYDTRRINNGTRAKAWLQSVEACEAVVSDLNKTLQPGR